MEKIIHLFLFVFFVNISFAQTGNVGIGTSGPNTSAKLDISAIDKGLLVPRVHLQLQIQLDL